MTTTIEITTEPDWWAVNQAAQGLGINTRRLVALHDVDAAITWCLQMRSQHSGTAKLSYYELAVMLGYRDENVTAGASLEWDELLRSVEAIAGPVKAKAAEEKRLADEAAAAARAAAEQEAAEKATREAAEDEHEDLIDRDTLEEIFEEANDDDV
jgi:hypothetical protein